MDRREFLGVSAAAVMAPAARAGEGLAAYVAAQVADNGFHGTVLVAQGDKTLLPGRWSASRAAASSTTMQIT